MNSYVHKWGVSAASDRVWTHVNGLAPARRAGRLLMVWQAYIDESGDDEVFVLGGYLAPAEAWDRFAVEWERLLRPMGYLGTDGVYRFKMSEMAWVDERMERVPAFYRVIEKHVSMALSFTLRLADFEKGRARVLSINPKSGHIVQTAGPAIENPYVYSFVQLMDAFHRLRSQPDIQELIPPNEKVDFIFDERLEKKLITDGWDAFLENSEHKSQYGAFPRFEKDEEFVPLQAADFITWWIREWYLAGTKPDHPWETKRELYWLQLNVDEDGVFGGIKQSIQKQYGASRTVFDRKNLVVTEIPTSGF